jgi:hypothetical protein
MHANLMPREGHLDSSQSSTLAKLTIPKRETGARFRLRVAVAIVLPLLKQHCQRR